jgi:aldose 1-epimerase
MSRPERAWCWSLLLVAVACQPAAQSGAVAPGAATRHVASSAAVSTAGAAAVSTAEAKVEQEPFGNLDGLPVQRYTLRNRHGSWLRVIEYGAILTELHVPDRAGQLGDIVLGFDRLEDYVQRNPFFGATVGRVANRIANARFELEGKAVALAANSGPRHLHGGKKGWDKVLWRAEPLSVAKGAALKLSYVSPDGEEGYPGTVTATTVYTLTDENELRIEMSATTDRTTLINMAHHSYFNLAGHASGTVKEQRLQLFASRYTPAVGQVPTGAVATTGGTPLDFTQPKAIGQDLAAVGAAPAGFDHNWLVDGEPGQLRPVARLLDPASGRVLTLSADQPGLQLYTGNHLDGTPGKGGAVYARHAGVCLETQKVPNSINVPAWREDVILHPGQQYQHQMRLRFSVQ